MSGLVRMQELLKCESMQGVCAFMHAHMCECVCRCVGVNACVRVCVPVHVHLLTDFNYCTIY